jgi:hypothetical protein
MSELSTLGTGELLIILFLMGMLLFLCLLVMVTAALLFTWLPHWLQEQHRRWHAERVDMTTGEE